MDEDIRAALELIGAINGVGRQKIELKLQGLEPFERIQIAALMRRVDGLAWWWQGSWVRAARAWMLAQVAAACIGRMGYGAPGARQMGAWLDLLRVMPEATVRQQLSDMVSGHLTLNALSLAQRNPARGPWNDLMLQTNPRHHDPRRFCYLVHALRPLTGLGIASEETRKMHDYTMKKIGAFVDIGRDRALTLRSAMLYLRHPEIIESEMLSCSLITETRRKLYGNFSFGFILQAPGENICIASTGDLALSNAQARASVLAMEPTPLHRLVRVDDFIESLLGLYQQPLEAPGALAAHSSADSHNEVVVLGFAGVKRIRVAGIFIKVTSRNRLWQSFVQDDEDHGLRDLVLGCAHRLGIPVVPIEDDNPKCAGSAVDFDDWCRSAPRRERTDPIAPRREPDRGRHEDSSLQVGDVVSIYRDAERTREYDMGAIRQDAGQMLAQGMTADEVHRRLHDDGHIPHAVIERVMNLLGQYDYL